MPTLHFNIDSGVLNLLQNGGHVAKQKQDQVQKTTTGRIGEGGEQSLSMETGKGLSQKSDPDGGVASIGMEGVKKDISGSAVNGAGGGEGWKVADRAGSGARLAVLLAVTLALL